LRNRRDNLDCNKQEKKDTMKVLFASDSFKGSLNSKQIISLLTEKALEIFPGCETVGVPVADGGEGTIDAVIAAMDGERRSAVVHGPLMEAVTASYGVFGGDSAVIEMAEASGLPMVPKEKRIPLYTTSYGTGELIQDALDHGYRKLSVAIGGSASNDGGMGAMSALGIRFLDRDGKELTGIGKNLAKVFDIDISGIHPKLREAEITVMCDVTNPLTGPDGATYTFGKQKGGTPEMLDELETGMIHYAAVMRDRLGIDVEHMPGAGAAGGMGAALCGFLHANLKSGIQQVLDIIGFERLLDGVDLVVTGEGRMDWQSAFGKVPSGVGLCCRERNIPVIAIVGGMGEGAESLYDYGISCIIPTVNGPMELDVAMEQAESLYRQAADRAFRMIQIGGKIKNN